MQIGELRSQAEFSRFSWISRRLLEVYDQGLRAAPRRRDDDGVEYSEEAADVVRGIRLLMDAGLNPRAIRLMLPTVHGEMPDAEVRAEVGRMLRHEVQVIDDDVDRLTTARARLHGLLREL